MKKLLALIVLPVFCAALGAQQLELNSAGGSLTRAGTNPVPGSPFVLSPSASIDLRIGGTPNSAYVFVLGQLTPVSASIPILGGQYFDLQTAGLVVIGDGIGFTGFLPPFWCVTGANGQSNWTFPTSVAATSLTFSFQAGVTDATLPPLNLNLTAAASYYVDPATILGTVVGDDNSVAITTSLSYMFYGQQRTQFCLSTNGYVSVSPVAFATALGESAPTMIAGNPNGQAPSPIICVDWEDLQFGLGTTQVVTASENIATQTLTFRWTNGQFYPSSAPWGSITLTIQDNAGSPFMVFDYSQYNPSPAPTEGLVGVSDGNTGIPAGPDVQANMVQAGQLVGYSPTSDYVTYFQTFDGTGTTPAEAIDVGGRVISFVDLTGNGQWFIF